MLSTFLLIYLLGSVSGGVEEATTSPRCRDSKAAGMTFSPVEGYVGRYIADLCTATNATGEEWKTEVSYYHNLSYCDTSNPRLDMFTGIDHSSNVEYVSKHNCTANQTVCVSAPFDLIFSACYSISSLFADKSSRWIPYYFNISNTYTEQLFKNINATVDVAVVENNMTLKWHTGVPVLVYKVTICNQIDLQNMCEPVSCSTVDPTTVTCRLSLEYGCYKVYFSHVAPWTKGVFSKQEQVTLKFCHNETTRAEQGQAAYPWVWTLAWSGAGAGAALVLGALARAVCRSAGARRKRKEVLRRWLVDRSEAAPLPGEGGGAGERARCRHAVLLYAREGERGARAVAALRRLLQHAVPGQVYDIFSPAVSAAGARAPGAWLRALLRRADVAVVLLQSPALHCLHADADGHTLGSPLLGRRVMPRVPHFGDSLLQYALRLTTENIHNRDNYHKYYIATLSGLPTEVLPCVVPYRRYELPGAAPLLLRDLAPPAPSAPLAPPAPPAPLLDEFAQSLNEFVEYARENPDYLMDELIVLDT